MLHAENRCNSLRGQLKQAWEMYQQVSSDSIIWGTYVNQKEKDMKSKEMAKLQTLVERSGLVLTKENFEEDHFKPFNKQVLKIIISLIYSF